MIAWCIVCELKRDIKSQHLGLFVCGDCYGRTRDRINFYSACETAKAKFFHALADVHEENMRRQQEDD